MDTAFLLIISALLSAAVSIIFREEDLWVRWTLCIITGLTAGVLAYSMQN